MRFLTDRKQVIGLGSAKTGTEHFWAMSVSSVALLLLIPMFIMMVGSMLGQPYEVVIAYFSRPLPAIVAALTILVGFMHFQGGARVLIEDYVHGPSQRPLIIAVICLSYAAAATGIFAIARIAL